ncbi:MAG: T9SS type A sorting domain-containing protein [Saprospiraceae bacterium]|nr:T9SS type A sorting domain-containing protein [Saprospiraceae bacterium]
MKPYLFLILVLATNISLQAQSIVWISPCSDQTFCLNPNQCAEGMVTLTEKAVTSCGNSTMNYLYRIDLYNNGGIEIQMSEDTFSANLPKGVHKISWRASDFCGNVSSCTYLITVRDCTPPNLLCLNGLTQAVDPPDCTIAFDVDLFILQLSDNCTPTNNIQVGMRRTGDTSEVFPTAQTLEFGKCDVGFNPLQILVKDGDGLVNSCNTYVIVQQNTGCYCDPDGDLELTGCSRTANNTALQTIRLVANLVSTGGVSPPVIKNKLQAFSDSCYALSFDQLPWGGSYLTTVRAERTDNAVNGVSTFDLVTMNKHILDIEPMTSMYQLLSSDVNNSKTVTTFDIAETRKVILGVSDTFSQVPAWRMIRPLANPSLLNQFNAVVDTYQLVINNLQQDLTTSGFNFVGIKMGDANLSAAFVGDPDDRSDKGAPLGVYFDEKMDGEVTLLGVHLAQNVSLEGWQLALQLDPRVTTVYDLTGVPPENWSYDSETGILRVLDFFAVAKMFEKGDALFNLRLKQPLSATKASLAPEVLQPEAYDAEGLRRTLFVETGNNLPAEDGGVVFYPAKPNPFHAQTSVNVWLSEPASVLFEVYDVHGKRIWNEYRKAGTEGLQSFDIDAVNLPGSGVYVYRLVVGENRLFSGKVVHW